MSNIDLWSKSVLYRSCVFEDDVLSRNVSHFALCDIDSTSQLRQICYIQVLT